MNTAMVGDKGTRVGYKILKDGKKARMSKINGNTIS